ncbi:MAG: succinyl-diaminopimelate desuccinylase [Pseudomonadota bacterium]|nr:succinyl-diaminopimelate desuccinylase [Pseudomonadota bacterium]
MSKEVFDLTCDLISRSSETPDDGGCQQLIAQRLSAAGFDVNHLPFGPVCNMWAKVGEGEPLVVFAGHTDVVPPGPLAQWRSPPFEPTVVGEYLYGRGAADMKSSLAAMTVATERFLLAHPDHLGSIGFLITSDEEGDATDGTVKVIDHLNQQGTRIDMCVVGEPSSDKQLGDVVRVGRRGSLNGRMRFVGEQGHVAYPDQACNPIHAAIAALSELTTRIWDSGNIYFPPTSFQISNIKAGTGATNVIPGELDVQFNFRFNTEHSAESLQVSVENHLRNHDPGIEVIFDWQLSGQPFLTQKGKLLDAAQTAIRSVASLDPELSTSGGTSDGRFIALTGAEVVELGPVNESIHKINECVHISDLETLAKMYQDILFRLLC